MINSKMICYLSVCYTDIISVGIASSEWDMKLVFFVLKRTTLRKLLIYKALYS
jgi:hypothetical protein